MAAESNGGDFITLLNVSTKVEIATLASASRPAFSPDGRVLATVNYYGDTIRLWEVATGRELAAIANQEGVKKLHFSADGRTLASGGEGPITLWPTDLGSWLDVGCEWLAPYLSADPDQARYSILHQDGSREIKSLCGKR